MNKLPEHNILKFHPDTLEYVRKEQNLDKPGQMDAAIDLLDDWVKKQAHFTKKDFSREYLERTIVLDKGSVERAKLQLDKLFTMRTSMPHFYDCPDANTDFEDLHENYIDAVLPKLTKDHYRVYAGKIRKECIPAKCISLAFKFGALECEHIRATEYCSGFIAIIDYRNADIIDLVGKLDLMELHQAISFITHGYQMRLKAMHVLTASRTIEILVRIAKNIFSKKMGDRIRVHMTLESLHECVSKDLLPEEFGGELKSLVDLSKDWVQVFGTREYIEYFKEMRKAGVNENLRNGSTNGKEDHLGISGSFRTLCVD